MTRKRIKMHGHDSVDIALVAWALGGCDRITGGQGWFYAGRLGSVLKIGITQGCPFCRMNQQHIRPLGLKFCDNCRLYEKNIKLLLGKPLFGAEFFDEGKHRFRWMVSRGYIETLRSIENRIALATG